jgi:hypothetical protein
VKLGWIKLTTNLAKVIWDDGSARPHVVENMAEHLTVSEHVATVKTTLHSTASWQLLRMKGQVESSTLGAVLLFITKDIRNQIRNKM